MTQAVDRPKISTNNLINQHNTCAQWHTPELEARPTHPENGAVTDKSTRRAWTWRIYMHTHSSLVLENNLHWKETISNFYTWLCFHKLKYKQHIVLYDAFQ